MATAEIVAIGTELLLGEIQDTNTQFLARRLRDAGIDLYRTTIVGDNEMRIAAAVQEAMSRADIVITSGGLGPTVDDPTRQAVARALNVDLEFRPELWAQIQDRFRRFNRQATENNRRQAYIPAGATAIENPVGTAPAFFSTRGEKIIICLPGVPRELEYLVDQVVFPLLIEKYSLKETIRAYVLHTAGVGESQVDEWIADLETNANPSVGLLAHPGQIDIRVTAKGSDPTEIERQIAEIAEQIRARVGEAIYGEGEETLEGILTERLAGRGWRLLIIAAELEGAFAERLAAAAADHRIQIQPASIGSPAELADFSQREMTRHGFDSVLAAVLQPAENRHLLYLYFASPDGNWQSTLSYGGPAENAKQWSVNTALDFARRNIKKSPQPEAGKVKETK